MSEITRSHTGPRMSQIVTHGETIYLAGQVGNEGDSVADQTKTCLEKVDALLAEANSIADVDMRREVMAKLQTIMIDEGVVIQPYWRTAMRHHRDNMVGVEKHIADLPQLYKFGLTS